MLKNSSFRKRSKSESLHPQKNLIFFLEKRNKKKAHISHLLGFTDGTRRPKVSSLN
jgi:hypothetical protein